MSTDAATPALERSWWLRAPAVLVAPRAVFVGLRDESRESVEERQEPITAIAGLAGIAGVLDTPVARQLLNDASMSTALVPVWAFVGGVAYALAVYWLGGALLFGASRRLGGAGSWRRSRHVLALASAPLALSLFTLWPVRIAVYGVDLFRTGGNDYGRGDTIFGAIAYGALAWSLWLLVVGVRSVHGWTLGRALSAVALAAVVPALIVAASTV
ncbi:MAG TPA: YIP1 family protein [Gaiellaceae bacterium]